MAFASPARHLLRAKDLADARYFESLGMEDMARVAGLSRAHFSREFRRAFGESQHPDLLTRRLELATVCSDTYPGRQCCTAMSRGSFRRHRSGSHR
jgi:AraC-like DNA-binding protein